ncbi:MAG TPA: hypothetical protein VGE15_00360 [Sphingobacteriaceae bacterium]
MIDQLRLPAALIMVALGLSCTRPAELKETARQEPVSRTEDLKETPAQETVSKPDSVQIWEFNRISGSRLEFTNGKGINTGLDSLQYIGQMKNGSRAPFLLYSGYKAHDSSDSWIYMYSPDQLPSEKLVRYKFPGTAEVNGKLSSRSRAFLGQVLEDREGLLYYQEQFAEGRSVQKTAFSVWVENGRLKHTLVSNAGKLRETLELLKEGKCTEIEGKSVSVNIPETTGL